MIDPPKATKGRRMSKKTRKKSAKTSSRRPARVSSTASAERKHQTKHAKGGRATMAKSSNRAVSEASHKAPSKRLRPSKPAGAASSQPAAASPAAGKSSVPVAGAKAPAFRLPRDGGNTVSLADYAGKKLVLFFYPRADTPGCTREAIDFTRLKGDFAAVGTAVLGISADTVKAQESFRNEHGLAIPLISDE